mmetsp:Transcript_19365/g.39299  ORF Transcript_19365/g.39299 Transcript_19365/m.39299 type:complete len:323 (-) Transcript_19365:100-1068(-)|eukprot:scaffold9940_cov161-Amphora_coffeaeformis.AAC.9
MDRSSIHSIFFSNNIGGGAVPPMDSTNYQAQQGSAGDSDAARALEIAGYPSLLQEYLWQQQQQQQQERAAAAALESRLTFSNQWGNFGNNNSALVSQGLNFGGGPSAEFDAMNHQQQQRDSNQLLLQRLQAANGIPSGLPPGLPAGVWGNNSSLSHDADQFALNGILGPWSERSAGLLGSMVATGPVSKPTKVKKGRRKQPKDKPKRPLSAYNIFFKEERARLLQKLDDAKQEKVPEEESNDKKTPSKIGFENLAKIIGSKWQDLTPTEVEYYKGKANVDMKRYKSEMETYLAKQSAKDNDDGKEGQEDEGFERPAAKKQKL